MKTLKNRVVLVLIASLLLPILIGSVTIQPAKAALPLDPTTIPKYVSPLIAYIPVYTPTNVLNGLGQVVEQDYVVNITQFTEQILPTGFPTTTVWGYGGLTHNPLTGANMNYFAYSPSPTFNVTKGIPTKIKWVNNLTDATVANNLLNYLYPVDPTLHWANPRNISMNNAMQQAMMGLAPPYPPGYNGSAILVNGTYTNPNQWNAQSPVPTVTHVHGAEVISGSDGGPEQWFTPNGIHGADYWTAEPTDPNAAIYVYNNTQEESTIWYHDHALGVTRINVYSGLAGFYIITDPAANPTDASLPTVLGAQDLPIAIQDRSFYADGSLRFDVDPPPNPDMHPYWVPEFFGDTFMVNGQTWPYMNVNQTTYRLRLLDGCNARFLNLSFIDLTAGNATVPFTVIARDQGYLNSSVTENNILMGPGMRSEVLINFTGVPAGHQILMKNSANAPFPGGLPVVTGLTDEVMMFVVQANPGQALAALPATLNPTLTGTTWPTLPANTVVRQRVLTLREVMGMGGPLEVLQDGQKWSAPATELPVIGTTEQWSIVNPTADAHPMHWHLVQFQLVSRQPFDDVGYIANWTSVNGMDAPFTHPTINLGNLTSFYTGPATGPDPDELGWLDTVTTYPGQITTVRIRYAQQTGAAYTIDPTVGPGYVWHCHIVDHEDNEMMRRQLVVTATNQSSMYAAIRATNSSIMYSTYGFGTRTWGTWRALPSGLSYDKVAAVSYNGRLYFAVKGSGTNSLLWFSSVNLTNNAFSGWTVPSGTINSPPTLLNYGSKLVLIVKGANNEVKYRLYDTTTATWGNYIGIPYTSTCDSPAAAVVGNTLNFVIRGFSTTNAAANNTLWYGQVNLVDNTFSGLTQIVGETTNLTPVLANVVNQNTLYLAIKNVGNKLMLNTWDGNAWGTWASPLAASINTSPAITEINGELFILVKGYANNLLWQYSLNRANSNATSWTSINQNALAQTLTR